MPKDNNRLNQLLQILAQQNPQALQGLMPSLRQSAQMPPPVSPAVEQAGGLAPLSQFLQGRGGIQDVLPGIQLPGRQPTPGAGAGAGVGAPGRGQEGLNFPPGILSPKRIEESPFHQEHMIKQHEGNRTLVASALQIGLPLALAGFGGREGLAAGAGLAGGFSEAASERERQKLFNQLVPTFAVSETGEPTITGAVPKTAKRVPTKDTKTKLRERVKQATEEKPTEAGKKKAQ